MSSNQGPVVADTPAALSDEQLDAPRGGNALAPAPGTPSLPTHSTIYMGHWTGTAASEY